jgi:hypothetical protein
MHFKAVTIHGKPPFYYLWEFYAPDGSHLPIWPEHLHAETNMRFFSEGTFTAKLTVQDGQSMSATATHNFLVATPVNPRCIKAKLWDVSPIVQKCVPYCFQNYSKWDDEECLYCADFPEVVKKIDRLKWVVKKEPFYVPVTEIVDHFLNGAVIGYAREFTFNETGEWYVQLIAWNYSFVPTDDPSPVTINHSSFCSGYRQSFTVIDCGLPNYWYCDISFIPGIHTDVRGGLIRVGGYCMDPVTLDAGYITSLSAYDEILLEDKFTADFGSDFLAQIVPCPAFNASCGRALTEPASPEPDTSGISFYCQPNPFTAKTEIVLNPEKEVNILLELSDIFGRKLMTLFEGRHPAGTFTVPLDGTHLPAAVYICTLTTEGGRETIKIIRTSED